ncbi:hypothetical protein CGSHiII_02645 [Haemophilus influenzae PittII]|nr:hypothetical protein CGSHiII_02645 [Haemophilus influenzae PittII]
MNIYREPLHREKVAAQNFRYIDKPFQRSFYCDDIGGKLGQASYKPEYRSSSPYSI